MTSRITLFPKTLAGRIVLLMLVAVVLSQVTSFGFMLEERSKAIRTSARTQIVERTVSVIRLLEQTPVTMHDNILTAAGSSQLRLWVSAEPPVMEASEGWTERRLVGLMRSLLDSPQLDIRINAQNQDVEFPWRGLRRNRAGPEVRGGGRMRAMGDADWHPGRFSEQPISQQMLALNVSVPLSSGGWLNAASDLTVSSIPWGSSILWAIGVAIVLCLIAVLFIRRITRSLNQLALATESVGRGEKVEPLDETGPEDIQNSIRAFNQMQDRLTRFVSDRTRLLAAMSHDLRTPITTLRLRAEFIEDEEIRSKILETLEDMQAMAEATLDFAREEAKGEGTRTVELSALISSLCDDLSQSGADVSFINDIQIDYPCRPVAMKRAITNLITNALNYGQYARVELERFASDIFIRISDGGPGIPEDQHEQVFQPFVRLETSRSRDTGGIGLGLAIARSVIRSHGGDLVLENVPEGGLKAVIRLPLVGND